MTPQQLAHFLSVMPCYSTIRFMEDGSMELVERHKATVEKDLRDALTHWRSGDKLSVRRLEGGAWLVEITKRVPAHYFSSENDTVQDGQGIAVPWPGLTENISSQDARSSV